MTEMLFGLSGRWNSKLCYYSVPIYEIATLSIANISFKVLFKVLYRSNKKIFNVGKIRGLPERARNFNIEILENLILLWIIEYLCIKKPCNLPFPFEKKNLFEKKLHELKSSEFCIDDRLPLVTQITHHWWNAQYRNIFSFQNVKSQNLCKQTFIGCCHHLL